MVGKASFNATVGDRFPEGESWDRLFNSDTVNLLLKTNGSGAEAESLIFLFCSLGCLICWQVGGDGVRQKVLFRAGWKHIFCIPAITRKIFETSSSFHVE